MIRILTTTVFLSLLWGCSTYKTPAEKLADSVFRYNDAVRWRNYVAASNYVGSKDRKGYLEKRRSLSKDMKVLDFEVGTVRYIKPNKEAEIQVRFTWHQLPSLNVKNTTFKQQWLYNETKQWIFVKQEEVKSLKPSSDVPVIDRF